MSPLRRARLGAVIAVFAAVLLPQQPSWSSGHDQMSPEAIEQERTRVARELDLAQASDTEVEAELARRAGQVRAQQAKVDSAQQASEAAETAVVTNSRDTEAVKERLSRTRQLMKDRAVNAYVRPPGETLSMVANAETVAEAGRRAAMLRQVQGDTADLADALSAARQDLASAERELEVAKERAAGRAAQEASALSALTTSQRQQATASAVLDGRIADLRGESADLTAQQAQVEAVIRAEAEASAAVLARQRAAEAAAASIPAQVSPPAAPPVLGSPSDAGSPRPASPEPPRRAPPTEPPRPAPQTPRPPPVSISPSGGGVAWPIRGPVTSEYGPRWGGFHAGLDISSAAGTPIAAARPGVVIFAGPMGAYGLFVLIDHGDGMVTAYAHQSRLAVGRGAIVSQGQVIGYVGSTGRSTGNHLHFEVRVGGSPRNPRSYLQ